MFRNQHEGQVGRGVAAVELALMLPLSLLVPLMVGRSRGSRHSDRGATAVEYALMASLIAVVIATAVGVFGAAVKALFVLPAGVWP